MSKRDAIFDEKFEMEGGRAIPTKFPFGQQLMYYRSVYRKFLTECERQAKQLGASTRVHFDFANGPSLNAAACKSKRLYLIGVNVGTFERLASLYSSLLSWPEVLPGVGDAKKEIARQFDVAACLDLGWRPAGARCSNNPSDMLFMPRDETRKQASVIMVMMALDFIVTHELAHIINGHVDYLGSVGGQMRLNETEMSEPALSPEAFQALEIDADREAASIVGSGLLHRQLIYRDFGAVIDEHTFLLLWVVTILVLFIALDMTGSSIEQYRKLEHPHPEARLHFILAALQAQAVLHKPELERTIIRCRREGLENVRVAMDLLGLGAAVTPNEKKNLAPFIQEMTLLNDSLRDRLEPVAKFAAKRKLGFSLGFRG